MCASRSLVILALAGCNQLFGIKDTAPEPAAFYDGGIDAARGCPAHGAMPDGYSPFVHEVYVQDCQDYSSVPVGRATSLCFDASVPTIHEGPAGQPLPPAGIVVPGMLSIYTPRLSPDGQRLLAALSATVYEFTRQPDGSWAQSSTFATAGPAAKLSTLAHAPTGDRVLVYGVGVTEWELQGTTWQQILVHVPYAPGDVPWRAASMTSDGLRLMVTKADQVYYADRSDTSQVFGTLVPTTGVPSLDDLFMTDDCARVYMSGFAALFYVEQD